MTNSISWAHDETIHAYWAIPGVVLAGEYPGESEGVTASDALSILLENGMRTFVDLTDQTEKLVPYEPALMVLAEGSSIEVSHISFPIPEQNVLDIDGYDAIVESIRSAAERGGVYVHGRLGLDRTAVVAGCLLIDSGLSYEGAMRTIKERRSETRLAETRAPNSFPQREVLIERADRGSH